MNLPNKLTLVRIIFIPFFLYFFFSKIKYGIIISMIIFILASLTDSIDGYIARKNNQVTNFGKLMDPLADKILIMTALVSFVEKSYIPSWFAILILSREFIVTGVRLIAVQNGEVVSAGIWGKIKTVSQIVIIVMIFINFGIRKINTKADFILIGIFIVLTLTFYSGYDYIRKNWKFIKEN